MSLLAFYDVYICIYYTFITISTYTTMIIIFKRLAKWDKWSHSSCGNKMKQTVLSNLLPLLDWRDVKGTSVEWGEVVPRRKKKEMIKYTHFLRYFSNRVWELFITVVLPFILKLLFHYPSIMQKSWNMNSCESSTIPNLNDHGKYTLRPTHHLQLIISSPMLWLHNAQMTVSNAPIPMESFSHRYAKFT